MGLSRFPVGALGFTHGYSCGGPMGLHETENLAGDESKAEVIAGLNKQLADRVAAQKVKPEGVEQIHFENRWRER